MAKYFAKALEGKEGTFISINSGNGIMTSPGQSSYCSNKAAGVRIVEQLHLGNHLLPSSPVYLPTLILTHQRSPTSAVSTCTPASWKRKWCTTS